jgi:hypothetical protein
MPTEVILFPAKSKAKVECVWDDDFDAVHDTRWYQEVSAILSPLQGVVDAVEVVIYWYSVSKGGIAGEE